jgi:hypothetical protein
MDVTNETDDVAMLESFEWVAGDMVRDLSAALWRVRGDPEGRAVEALGTLLGSFDSGSHYGAPRREHWRRFRTASGELVEHGTLWSFIADECPRGLTRRGTGSLVTHDLLAAFVDRVRDGAEATLLRRALGEHGVDLGETDPGPGREHNDLLEVWAQASSSDRRAFLNMIGH